MSLEAELTTTEETPPPAVVEAKPNGKADKKKEPKPDKVVEAKKEDGEDNDEGKSRAAGSAELKKIQLAEDATLREIVEALGDEGSFNIKIAREEPEYWPDASGKKIAIRGYLETISRKIDEEWLQKKYGGGTFKLTFRRKGGTYVTHRTIVIAGEPDLTMLPKSSVTPAAAAQPQAEAPTIAVKSMELMSQQLLRAEERAERAAGGGSNDTLIAIMNQQLENARQEKADLMRVISELRAEINKPPPQTSEDKVKDRLFEKLIDGDSARLTAVRTQYDSEIRTIKEAHQVDLGRVQDRMDREMQQLRNTHERELALVRQSHENQLATLKSSHEIALASAKASFETQAALLQADNRRLERDNNELRDEVKELRQKKDKTIIEQVKDIKVLKDALGVEDESEPASAVEKVVEAVTNPDTLAAVGQMFKRAAPDPAAQQQAAATQQPQRPRPQVVRDKASGQKFILRDGQLIPAKKAPPPGTPPEVAALPEINPDELKMVVSYLESACQNGTDPQLVIQSFGSHVPESIRVAIRDLGGVDQFLIKVAKLPSSSPLLANQAGKNWCRKLGKALAGE